MIEKNLTEFESHSKYIDFTGSTKFMKPNVSYCDDRDEVHYIQLYVVTGITISETAATIATNEKQQLTANILPLQANQDVSWTSSNESVATVNADGLVSPVASGNCTITVTSVEDPSYIAKCEMEVTPVLPTGVVISESAITVPYSRTYQLTATVFPEDADDKRVSWSSSDETVATVDDNGLVTSVGKGGSCTITVRTLVGGYEDQCEMTTDYVPVTGMTLAKDYDGDVVFGRQVTVTATVLPENASVRGVDFNLGGDISARVDSTTENTVTFTIRTDTSTFDNKSLRITGTSVDNSSVTGYTTCYYRAKSITSVTLSETEKDITFGSTHELTATTLPSDAKYEDDTIKWVSSNEDIIKIISYNGVKRATVEAVGLGDATITVTAGFKNKSASCIYHANGVHVTGVTISETAATVADNHTYQLTASVTPDDASVKKIIWSSSDETIATVDQNGFIKALKVGNCNIIATAADGGISASCALEVISDFAGMYLTTVSESEGTKYNAGGSIQYSMDGGATWENLGGNEYTPETSVGQEVLWKRNSDSLGLHFSGTTGSFSLKGNLLSLQYGDDFKFKDICGNSATFEGLFENCTGLINAENLRMPAKIVTNGSLYGLFMNCTNLTDVYEYIFSEVEEVHRDSFKLAYFGCSSLRTHIRVYGKFHHGGSFGSYYVFEQMCQGCTSITGATIYAYDMEYSTDDAFRQMFEGCTSLQRVEIPNLTVVMANSTFYRAFKGCTSLNYISLPAAESTTGSDYESYRFREWVDGVAENGTFVKNANATFWTRGIDGIPENWTVEEQ